MILFFIYTHDNIQQRVKEETSLLGERRRRVRSDGIEVELFDEIVFDEEYESLFRRLFLEAHAELLTGISSNYLKDTPTDLTPVFREFPDYRQDRDFLLWLNMPCDFTEQYRKSIDVKIEQFIIDYICWRWLETKSPQDAATYFGRWNDAKEKVKKMLARKNCPISRLPSFP